MCPQWGLHTRVAVFTLLWLAGQRWSHMDDAKGPREQSCRDLIVASAIAEGLAHVSPGSQRGAHLPLGLGCHFSPLFAPLGPVVSTRLSQDIGRCSQMAVSDLRAESHSLSASICDHPRTGHVVVIGNAEGGWQGRSGRTGLRIKQGFLLPAEVPRL